MAAAALTRKSLLERLETGGLLMRRGPPMVAFTCGSEETGMRARGTCGAAAFDPDGCLDGGETGESGTASGSISGNGSRGAVRGDDDAVETEAASTAAMRDSGESGDSGERT
jgi:hypothetical protein